MHRPLFACFSRAEVAAQWGNTTEFVFFSDAAAALPQTEESIISTHHMCDPSAPLSKNSPQTCVSTLPRRIFGPIHPVPAFLWHPHVPGGDGHGTVHLARVHHLLEVLLPLV